MFKQLRLIKESDIEVIYEVDGQIITCSQYTCSHNYTCFYFVYNNTVYVAKYYGLDRGCPDVQTNLSQYGQVIYL
jgi:hypothetical protein